MNTYGIYNKKSGNILCIYNGPTDASASIQCGEGEDYILGANDDSQEYVDVHAQKIRKKSEISEEVEIRKGELQLGNIPTGTKVFCEGNSEICSGTMTLEMDEPGIYIVSLEPPAQYKPKTLEVEIP